MKNYIMLFLVIFICSCQIKKSVTSNKDRHAIRKTTVIVQTPYVHNDTLPKYVRYNSQVYFMFEDFNPFLYNITFTEHQRDMMTDFAQTPTPYMSAQNKNFTIEKLNVGNFAIPEVSTGKVEQDEKTKMEELKDLQEKIKNHNETLDGLKTQIGYLDTFEKFTQLRLDTTITDEVKAVLVENTHKKEVLNKLKKENMESIESFTEQSQVLLSKIQNDSLQVYYFRQQLKDYLNIVDEIRGNVNFYNDIQLLLHSRANYAEIEFKKETLIRQYFTTANSTENIFEYCNGLLPILEKEYNNLIEIYNNIGDKKAIKYSYERLNLYHASLGNKDFKSLFIEIKSLLNAINKNNWNYHYQTTAISDKADKISFEFSAIPNPNQYSKAFHPIKYNYNFDVRGGVKIDVSASLFWHVGMVDDEYKFLKKSDTTTEVFRLHDNFDMKPTVGTLFNIYWRSNRQIKPSLNFGLGTDIEKIYYYLGGGVLLGRSERFAYNFGLVGGPVNKISKMYTGGSIINEPIESLPADVPMSAKTSYRLGGYFGISYNLTGNNKTSMEKMINQKNNVSFPKEQQLREGQEIQQSAVSD